MPSWHWRSRHTLILERPPDAVFTMIGELVVAELPTAVRHGQRRPQVRVLDNYLRQGFRLFTEERPVGYLLGRIGRFWNRYERHVAPETARNDPAWFARFAEPGFAKAALGITCLPVDGGAATLLVAETRIVATDAHTREEFNRHWLVGSLANPHAQQELLRAVHHRLAA